MFRALLLEKEPQFQASVQSLDESRLPEADVHVRVAYSTLNYKDGLAITNKSPVVRVWPMVAGIDGAGTVISSRSQPASRMSRERKTQAIATLGPASIVHAATKRSAVMSSTSG